MVIMRKKKKTNSSISEIQMQYDSFKLFFKGIGKDIQITKDLSKTEMDQDEVDGINYRDKKDEWLPFVKQDVLCTAFSYARYIKAMEENTGFGMKDCLSLPGLGWKYFKSLRNEENEPIYTYNDKYMRLFVRQSIKRGRVCAFNQYYKSKICDDILKIISEELNVKGNVYDIIETYMKFKNEHLKIIEEEYESKFDDYRDIGEEEMNNHINKKLCEYPIHTLLQELSLDDLLWDFDAVSLYPSAMSDPESIYPRIEMGYAYTKNMIDELVNKFNAGNFTRGIAFLKIKYCNLKNLIVQHLPVKERVKKLKINRMRNG